MSRSIRLLIGAVVLVFGGASFAQAPPEAANADGYFPMRPKTKWTYKVGDQTVDVVVAGTQKIDNVDCTQVDTLVNGKVVASELYSVKPDGVYRVKVKDDKIEPPVKVLALPVKKDASWDIKSNVGKQTVSGTFKIKDDKDKVVTPAGTFEAVLVEGHDLDVAGTKTTVKMWFVKEKGIVKLSYKMQDTESVLELTKYEPPSVAG